MVLKVLKSLRSKGLSREPAVKRASELLLTKRFSSRARGEPVILKRFAYCIIQNKAVLQLELANNHTACACRCQQQ